MLELLLLLMDNTGEVGESSTPQRSYAVKLAIDVHTRLMDSCSNEVRNIPNLHDVLEAHFTRLPLSYALDMNVDRAEDVLIHHMLLEQAAIHASRPAFYIRFLERLYTKSDGNEGLPLTSVNSELSLSRKQQKVAAPSSKRTKDGATEFEPYSKLEDLNLDVLKNTEDVTKRTSDETPKRTKDGAAEFERCSKLEDLNLDVLKHTEDVTERRPSGERPKRRVPEPSSILTHEVIFSTVDKPKLLSQLSALLSDIGLNIREAHVFSTIDGYSLDVFVVDGCNEEDTAILEETMKNAIANSEHRYSHSQSVIEKALGSKCFDWEIDLRLLKREEKIGSGFGGDLYRGTYKGQDVAIKELNRKLINEDPMSEFAQELKILRETRHRNVVSFFGACTKFPLLCILTEYMSGGNLYAYLQSRNETLKLSQLLKFAIDICKGMEYLHSNNIIHRDLKTPNLLLSSENVVKVCDFGISRFQNRDGVMTAERGTYRWMAPEVMKHLPYDEKADVFSFAIVLWELVTGKLPYRSMTPLQAAMTLVQGMRLEIPENTHPKLTELIQRCWEDDPTKRPAFSSIAIELECLLQEVEQTSEVEEGAVEIL